MSNISLSSSRIPRRRRTTRKEPGTSTKAKVLKSVRVRMYRQGLGDCFLLTFTNVSGEEHHMLIDCGVLPFSSGGDKRLDLIAQNILAETGNHLQTVVATLIAPEGVRGS